jgi:hypothetical protein
MAISWRAPSGKGLWLSHRFTGPQAKALLQTAGMSPPIVDSTKGSQNNSKPERRSPSPGNTTNALMASSSATSTGADSAAQQAQQQAQRWYPGYSQPAIYQQPGYYGYPSGYPTYSPSYAYSASSNNNAAAAAAYQQYQQQYYAWQQATAAAAQQQQGQSSAAASAYGQPQAWGYSAPQGYGYDQSQYPTNAAAYAAHQTRPLPEIAPHTIDPRTGRRVQHAGSMRMSFAWIIADAVAFMSLLWVFFAYLLPDLTDQAYIQRGKDALSARIAIEKAVNKAHKRGTVRKPADAGSAATSPNTGSEDAASETSDDTSGKPPRGGK